MKISLFSGPGTRQWPRFSIEDFPSIRGIKSAAGSSIDAVDISRGGALLLTPRRLIPGTRIRLHIETSEGGIPVAALVLRSSHFSAEEEAQYQAAVVFDSPLPITDDCRDQAMNASQVLAHDPDRNISTIADFLAIDFCSDPDSIMPEMLKLNDW